MSAILKPKPTFAELQTLMPSIYQQDSLQALLGLFLDGQGVLYLNTAKPNQLAH